MRFIERLCSNNKVNNLRLNAVIHTWIIIIILFISLFYLLITRTNITVNKYKRNETINSNEIWNIFFIDQTHIFKNNNINGIGLKLAQSNTSTLPSINNSINANNNNHSQLEGYKETNTFGLSQLHSRLHEIKNNKYNNTKSKYDLNVSTSPAALHPNYFGLSNSNIDLDLIVRNVICYNIKPAPMVATFFTVISKAIFYIKNVTNKYNNNNPQNNIWKSVTNYQRRNSIIALPSTLNIRRKEPFKFAMDTFDGIKEQKSIVSQIINTEHKRHISLRINVKKLSISITFLYQQNNDNNNNNMNNTQSDYIHTNTHSDYANVKCKK